MKSQNPLTMWSYDVTCEIKTIMSPFVQYLWPSNFTEWLGKFRMRRISPWSYMIIWSCSHMTNKRSNTNISYCAMTTEGHKTSWVDYPHHRLLLVMSLALIRLPACAMSLCVENTYTVFVYQGPVFLTNWFLIHDFMFVCLI